jgi:4-hydroxybenzoate polyprenyltransferase
MNAAQVDNWSAFKGIARAARMEKNLPLLLLVVGGAHTIRASVSLPWLAFTLVIVLLASAFMTHVNVITDAELDRKKKPQLMMWLNRNPRLSKVVIAAELLLVILGIAVLWLATKHQQIALGVGLFTAISTLYSFNFITPAKGRKHRLKANWWGHFIVLIIGYMSLWYAGYYCTTGDPSQPIDAFLPLFFCVSLSEYSLFLSESSFDAEEERESRLSTLAAVLGERGCKVVALLLWTVSCAGLVWELLKCPQQSMLILAAFVPAVLLRGVMNLLLLVRRWDAIPDLTFLGSRILTVTVLLTLNS